MGIARRVNAFAFAEAWKRARDPRPSFNNGGTDTPVRAAIDCLHKFNPAVHLLGCVALVQNQQHSEMLTERVFLAMAVGKAGVFNTLRGMAKIVIVVGGDDSVLFQRKGNLSGIITAPQTRLGRRGDIHAMRSQASGNAGMNMLIQVKANRHESRGPGESDRGIA